MKLSSFDKFRAKKYSVLSSLRVNRYFIVARNNIRMTFLRLM